MDSKHHSSALGNAERRQHLPTKTDHWILVCLHRRHECHDCGRAFAFAASSPSLHYHQCYYYFYYCYYCYCYCDYDYDYDYHYGYDYDYDYDYEDYPVGYDGGGGYGYGYGGESYVSWFPIAFTPTDSFPTEYADEMVSGSVTFDGTLLTWTSTFSYPTYTYAYVDPYCGMYGGGAEPIVATPEDSDEAWDTGGWDGGWDTPTYDTHAAGFVDADSLPCTLASWWYGGYTGDADTDYGDESDWGEEEAPDDGAIPPEHEDEREDYYM